MKIAIVGAGLAGLSCAHELERYGIKAVIYDRNGFIGEAFPHIGAALEIVMRPIKNPITYLINDFGIALKPINAINSVIHHSPDNTTVIKGKLGYFLERSKQSNDIKVQIHSSLKLTTVLLNTNADYLKLSKENDYVVVATGLNKTPKELGLWMDWLNTWVKGAVVSGDFDPNAMVVWVNKHYCKNGYAYLTPFSNKRAALHLVVTDILQDEIEIYWQMFLANEHLRYPVTEEFIVEHNSGHVFPHKTGNLLFAGNAGGMMDSFLGFGVSSSIMSGVLAARSIIQHTDYEELLKPLIEKNLQLLEFRKAFNALDNRKLDIIIRSIGLPGIKHITYYTPLNIVKRGSQFLKLFGTDKV